MLSKKLKIFMRSIILLYKLFYCTNLIEFLYLLFRLVPVALLNNSHIGNQCFLEVVNCAAAINATELF